MGRSSGFLRFVGGGASSAVLTATAAAMFLGRVSAQTSCVQVANTSFVPSCPCGVGSAFTFGIEGQTEVTANTVNVAIVLDGSGSIAQDDFVLSIDFAKNTVAAFADENLFTNGGTASFTQFSNTASVGGTFYSQQEFDAHVDAEVQFRQGTDIPSGVARGNELLAAAPNTTTSFMVVLTDGSGGDPKPEADAARAAGTIVYAVGVGSGTQDATLLDIAGEEANVFNTANFTALSSALKSIISSSEGSIPCAATGAILSLEFNTTSVAEASIDDASGNAVIGPDGTTVTFELSGTLEATPTAFSMVLDFCAANPGDDVFAAVTYSDNEGNTPDLSPLEGSWATVPFCVAPTPSPATTTPCDRDSSDRDSSSDSRSDSSSDDDHTPRDDDSGMDVCSNGLPGIESANGKACCALGCGQCGGRGCSKSGAPALNGNDCCTKKILKFGKSCTVTGEAPCYMDN